MKHILCFVLTILSINYSFSQDSAVLFFNKVSIQLPDSLSIKTEVVRNNRFRETIVRIDQDKYFYIRHDLDDTSAVEFGQLERFRFKDGFYLLRTGVWVLENEDDKIMFSNFGNHGWKEEIRIRMEPFTFDSPEDNHSKKTKKVRTIKS